MICNRRRSRKNLAVTYSRNSVSPVQRRFVDYVEQAYLGEFTGAFVRNLNIRGIVECMKKELLFEIRFLFSFRFFFQYIVTRKY